MELRFFPVTIFRETPKVRFFDTGINKSNGSDVVIHSGEAKSPPDDFKNHYWEIKKFTLPLTLLFFSERVI